MRQAVGFAVVAVVLVLALVGMVAGWRGRARRQATLVGDLPAVPDADALGPAVVGPFPGTYVSTTVAGEWLERVVPHGLGDRAACTVAVHRTGVLIARTGAHDLFLATGALRGVERAAAIAGKAVGGEGLVVLRWEGTATGTDQPGAAGTTRPTFDTGLRLRYAADRDALTAAVAGLVPAAAHPSSEENA